MVRPVNEKVSEMDQVSPPGPEYIVQVGNPGVKSYQTRLDATGGYVSVTRYTNIRGDGVYDCTTGITTAVAAAAAGGYALFWPAGTYLTTASIPLLHTVRHVGPGIIKRGSDLFYPDIRNGLTNRLYVSTSGVAANDGLSSSQPMLTAAGLFSAMSNYGPTLNGTWQGIFAAGTYVTLNATFDTPSRNLVTFKGPAAGGIKAVPTAIFSGTGAGASDFGARAHGPGVQVLWQDIKFTTYNNASTNNIALLADYGADLWTYNVHVASSTGQGIYGEDCHIVRMTGGIIDGCRQGILLNACNMVTLGYQHSTNADGEVKNCTQTGIEWSRGTNGHCDLMTLSGNAVGLDVFHASRVHAYSNAFTSNTIAIRAKSGGYYLDDTNTYTTNTENWRNYATSGETDTELWNSIAEKRRAYSTNSVTHTGTVTKTTLISPWTIPQNFFITPSANASTKKIRIVIHGQFTTAGALSKIGVDFDSVVIDQSAAVAPGANAKFKYEVEIWADGNAAQYKSATLFQSGASIIQSQSSPAQNMANAARNINITGELANAADSMRIDRTEVWVSG